MNGPRKAQARLMAFMREVQRDPGNPEVRDRFDALLRAMYDSARIVGKDGAADRKTLLEQCAGRAKLSPDELMLAVADHLRKVARDQADVMISILGPRLQQMTDEEKAAFFNQCSVDPRRYLQEAEDRVAAQRGESPIVVALGAVVAEQQQQQQAKAEPAQEPAKESE